MSVEKPMSTTPKRRFRDFPITPQAIVIWLSILGSVAGYQLLWSSHPQPLTTTIDIPHEGRPGG